MNDSNTLNKLFETNKKPKNSTNGDVKNVGLWDKIRTSYLAGSVSLKYLLMMTQQGATCTHTEIFGGAGCLLNSNIRTIKTAKAASILD